MTTQFQGMLSPQHNLDGCRTGLGVQVHTQLQVTKMHTQVQVTEVAQVHTQVQVMEVVQVHT